MKYALMGLGAVACFGVMPVIERLFSSRQTANSPVALVVMLAFPFVSMIVWAAQPNAVKVSVQWIALAVAAFFAGDAYVILRDAGDNHTLWPIELVMLTGLAVGALFAGAAVGRALTKGARTA